MSLPNEEGYKELDEFSKQMQASHWALLVLISEIASGFHVLVDRLSQKDVIDDEDAKAMDKLLLDEEIMRGNYMQIQRAFQEKYNRVRYAAENPEKVTEYVKSKKAGEDVADPLKAQTASDPGDNGPLLEEEP